MALTAGQQKLLSDAEAKIAEAQKAYDAALKTNDDYLVLVADKERAYNYFLNLHDSHNGDIVRSELDAMRPTQQANLNNLNLAKSVLTQAQVDYENLKSKILSPAEIAAEKDVELAKVNYAQSHTKYLIIAGVVIVVAVVFTILYIKRKKISA